MATGKLDVAKQAHHLGRLTVFAGVRDLPTRVKCAILPWHTLHAALHSVASTSTEAEDDPMHAPIGGCLTEAAMPKIADIEDTPNPNAKKFILKEPLTWGIARSYDNAEQAKDDPLAASLFDIEHVTNVFYVDHWITVTQDGGADWQELLRRGRRPDPRRAGGGRAIGAAHRRGRDPRSPT